MFFLGSAFVGYKYSFLTQEDETIVIPEVMIVQKPTLHIRQLGIGTEIVIGPQDKTVTFLKFEARADDGDILLNKLVFMDGNGRVRLKNYGNLSLWVDADNDSKADTRPAQEISDIKTIGTNHFVVDNIGEEGYLLTSGSKTIFELRADGETLMENKEGIIMLFRAEPGESYVVATEGNTKEPLRGIKTTTWDGGRILTDSYCEDLSDGGYDCDISVKTARHLMVLFLFE